MIFALAYAVEHFLNRLNPNSTHHTHIYLSLKHFLSLASTKINVSKTALNTLGVHIIAKNWLRNVKSVLFSLLCILFGLPMGGGRVALSFSLCYILRFLRYILR